MKRILEIFAVVFCTFFTTACGTIGTDRSDVISSIGSYALGDIVFADGSIVRPSSFTAIDHDNLPVAVLAVLKDGAVIGIGVHRSAECLRFEARSTNEKTASDFVAEYATAYHIDGEYASGWRLPEVEELKMIYENRNAIDISLQKIFEFDHEASMSGLSNLWYWTGTPADTKEGFTWFVHFVNGYAGECERDLTNLNVIAVRNF